MLRQSRHHRTVVGGEPGSRGIQLSVAGKHLAEPFPQGGVAGDAPADDHPAAAGQLRGTNRLGDQHLDDGLLELRRQVVPRALQSAFLLFLDLRHEQREGGLEAAEGEIEPGGILRTVGCPQHRARERVTPGPASRRRALDLGPSGILEAEAARHFVERLAGRVITRLAQQCVPTPLRHPEKQGVPPAHQERHERGLGLGVLEGVGEQVGLHVVDPDDRKALAERQSLGPVDAHQKAADEAGTGRHADTRQLIRRHARLLQRRFDDQVELTDVRAGRDLGDDPAESAVHILGSDDVTSDLPILDDPRGCLIARGLDPEDGTAFPGHVRRPDPLEGSLTGPPSWSGGPSSGGGCESAGVESGTSGSGGSGETSTRTDWTTSASDPSGRPS